MDVEPALLILTEIQKQDVCTVVGAGCDRETAAKYARTSSTTIRAAMEADAEFAAEVRYKEAAVELHHMLNIYHAGKTVANWRTSAWWLERLAPERYGPRGAGTVTTRQLKTYIEHISATLIVDVPDDEVRKQLLDKLKHTAKTLELLFRDESISDPSVVPTASSLLSEVDAIDPQDPSDDSTMSTDEEEAA
jgi:hypothetical protein